MLTAERLAELASYEHIQDSWYIPAIACISQLNLPEDAPVICYFALQRRVLNAVDLVKLAQQCIDTVRRAQQDPSYEVPQLVSEDLPLLCSRNDVLGMQQTLIDQTREVILKISVMIGMPKSINAMMALKAATPKCLMATVHRTTMLESDTSEVTPNSINVDQLSLEINRGTHFWNAVYSKISQRVQTQIYNAYPDLWNYIFHHIYSPLLSYTDILPGKETSFAAIACMIPQDVNPQLKGHLKGALNNGASVEQVNSVRQLVLDMCEWKGDVTWKDGKESIPRV
ncbi:uncharacterized protein SPAPADRAFT_61352 [Spathaspora passalidarum NRRL Y-27907]|uniref:Carboxymuconolactone decarboxylase-like domain-containing protein n=1 Tax=Spathaspora passalidarum (strain NRRL Y-27907 / 11-Y1) TaxID=619300 RepID=G3APV0_SPAPN|nr:uncharacterized protein SPAPADRAFT_61352 [Spathaspora passalidarum NRRL Y-27907]EGW32271.1 hypothetical protein SPAPADRAFT_61352 [Spathaspora passalidarum NRRL Y-27907]